ncbi:MAG: hypothetical protein ACPGN3_07265 [Opitutales bacterium]
MIRTLLLSTALIATTFLNTACNSIDQVGQTVSPNNRICVELDAPNPGWILGIQEVRVDASNHLHVYAEAKILKEKENRFTASVISQTGDCVRVPRNGRGMTIYLAGATWNWVPEEIVSVSGVKEYRSQLEGEKTKRLFPFN